MEDQLLRQKIRVVLTDILKQHDLPPAVNYTQVSCKLCCPLCKRTHQSKREISVHMFSCHKTTCHLCGKVYPQYKGYRFYKHLLKHSHLQLQDNVQCQSKVLKDVNNAQCSQGVTESRSTSEEGMDVDDKFQEHFTTAYICVKCSQLFSTIKLLSEHKDSEHKDSEHKDSEHKDSEHKESEHKDSEHKDSEHKDSEHKESEHKESEHKESEHKESEHKESEHKDNEHKANEHKGKKDNEHKDNEHRNSEHMASEHKESKHKDNEHKDNEHGDNEHGDSEHGDSEHGDSQHGDSKHKDSKRKISKPKINKPKINKLKISKLKISKPKISKHNISKHKIIKHKISKHKISKHKGNFKCKRLGGGDALVITSSRKTNNIDVPHDVEIVIEPPLETISMCTLALPADWDDDNAELPNLNVPNVISSCESIGEKPKDSKSGSGNDLAKLKDAVVESTNETVDGDNNVRKQVTSDSSMSNKRRKQIFTERVPTTDFANQILNEHNLVKQSDNITTDCIQTVSYPTRTVSGSLNQKVPPNVCVTNPMFASYLLTIPVSTMTELNKPPLSKNTLYSTPATIDSFDSTPVLSKPIAVTTGHKDHSLESHQIDVSKPANSTANLASELFSKRSHSLPSVVSILGRNSCISSSNSSISSSNTNISSASNNVTSNQYRYDYKAALTENPPNITISNYSSNVTGNMVHISPPNRNSGVHTSMNQSIQYAGRGKAAQNTSTNSSPVSISGGEKSFKPFKFLIAATAHTVICGLCNSTVANDKISLRAHFFANHKDVVLKRLEQKRQLRVQSEISPLADTSGSHTFPLRLSCPKCSFETVDAAQLSEHLTFLHFKGLQYCDQCDYSSLFEDELTNHKSSFHAKKACKYCQFVTVSDVVLRCHIGQYHK